MHPPPIEAGGWVHPTLFLHGVDGGDPPIISPHPSSSRGWVGNLIHLLQEKDGATTWGLATPPARSPLSFFLAIFW
jgi:hypothetical protein